MLTWIQSVISRIGTYQVTRSLDHDFDEELQSHFTMLVDDFVRLGMPVEEARRKAAIELGNRAQLMEAHRAERGLPIFDGVMRDLRYGFRVLRKNSGFTLTTVLTLSLGIGFTASLFSVVLPVLRPPPIPESDRVVQLLFSDGARFRLDEFRELQKRSDLFSEVAAYLPVSAGIRRAPTGTNNGAARSSGLLVTGSYFRLLGARAEAGHLFGAEGDQPGPAEPSIVLSHAFWQQHFSSDADVVGSTVYANGRPLRVAGVMASGFRGLDPTMPDYWLPLSLEPVMFHPYDAFQNPDARWLRPLARMRAGITIKQVQAAMTASVTHWRRRGAGSPQVLVASSSLINAANRGRALLIFGLTFASVGFVLLIACVNVSNLLLARSLSRQREIATRVSLGAGRATVIRQLLVESLLLAVMGAAGGLVLANSITPSIVGEINRLSRSPGEARSQLDGGVLTITIVLSCLCGVLCGLIPALQSTRWNLSASVKEGALAWHGRARNSRITDSFVVVQVALSVALLMTACLFVRTLTDNQRADLGLDTDSVYTLTADLRRAGYTEARAFRFFRDLLNHVSVLPEVESASLTEVVPATDTYQMEQITIDGQESSRSGNSVASDSISAHYFQTLRIPVLRGQTTQEPGKDRSSVVVNESFEHQFFPHRDAVGKYVWRLASGSPAGFEIEGVVRDSMQGRIGAPAVPMVYFPVEASRNPLSLALMVRLRSSSARAALVLGNAAAAVDPQVTCSVTSLITRIRDAMWPAEVGAFIASLTGFSALIMAAVGLFGVTSFWVRTRTRELGIRIALGAKSRDVLIHVVGRGLRLCAIGLGVGLLLGGVLAFGARSLLYGLSPFDFRSLLGCTAILLAAALVATCIPARRASRLDPLQSLRDE